MEDYFVLLALSIKLLEWSEIKTLVKIQKKHQREVVDQQVSIFKKQENMNRIFFWLL
jgi:hypothetical protein